MGEPARAEPQPTERVNLTRPDGSVYNVPADQADIAKAADNSRPTTDAEYFGAKHGAAGDVAAGVVGAARGATLGLSDPFYVEGARLLGGDAKAEDVRNTIRLLKQTSPNASLAGEIGGTTATAIATGGIGAEATAALEAGALTRFGTGAAAKFGARAVAAAPRAILEGAAINAGQQLSEDTLENHKLVGEAYTSQVLKGGLTGLFLGAGGAGLLGHVGDKAGALFGRGERAAVGAEGALVRAEEGGVYRTAARAEEGVEAGGRKSLATHAEELRDELTYGATGAGRKDVAKLGATLEEQTLEKQRLGGVLRDEVGIRPTSSQADISQAVLAKKNDIGATLAPMYREADAAAARPSMAAIDEGMAAIRAKHTGIYAAEDLHAAETAFAKLKALGPEPTHSQLWEASKDVWKRGKLDIESSVAGKDALHELHGVMKGELAASVDRASAELGGTLGDRLRSGNALFADLSTLSEGALAATKRGGGGGLFTLGDKVLAGSALLSGHPAAAAAVGLSLIKRKYGQQIGAHVLDTALRNETFVRALSSLDSAIDSGAKAFVSGSKGAVRASKPVTTSQVAALREATRAPEAVTARVAESLGDMPKVAPKVAQQIALTASRAAAWLQHALPKEQTPMTPQFGKPREVPLSDEQLLKARATIETVEDPSIVIDRMRDGSLTDAHVAALRFVHPETFAQMQKYLTQHATELGKTMTTQQLFRLGLLFGEPLTEAALPVNVRAFQASFSQGNQAPGQGGSGGNTGMAAMRPGPVVGGGNSATPNDKLEAGK